MAREKDKERFEKGDKMIEFGRVWRIFEVERREGRIILFFRPFFKTTDREITGSIPEKNVRMAGMRRPSSKERIKELLGKLAKEKGEEREMGKIEAESVLKENDLKRTIWLLQVLKREKKRSPEEFHKKRAVFERAMNSLHEETAASFNFSLKKAQGKVEEAWTER